MWHSMKTRGGDGGDDEGGVGGDGVENGSDGDDDDGEVAAPFTISSRPTSTVILNPDYLRPLLQNPMRV